MKDRNQLIISIYAVWAFLVFAITFVLKVPDSDNVTHILIMLMFLAQLAAYPVLSKLAKRHGPKASFIAFGLVFAACVEGFYMISAPVFGSLRVTAQTSLGSIITHYLADLFFTLPAYAVIFAMIWFFINKYEYDFWEYFILITLGQTLGDGGAFFFMASPLMLAFLPYVMVNYHSMNVIPYLLVRDGLKPTTKSRWKYIVPPASIILAYLVLGSLIKVAGSYLALA